MKVYNLIISNEKWTSVQTFGVREEAFEHVHELEDGQRKIEGDSLKSLFHYTERDMVTPPFHAEGKRIYCSYAWTEIEKPFKHEGCTWRAIYEQEI